jgi:hypothetical protein
MGRRKVFIRAKEDGSRLKHLEVFEGREGSVPGQAVPMFVEVQERGSQGEAEGHGTDATRVVDGAGPEADGRTGACTGSEARPCEARRETKPSFDREASCESGRGYRRSNRAPNRVEAPRGARKWNERR